MHVQEQAVLTIVPFSDPVETMIQETTLDLSVDMVPPPTLLSIEGQSIATLGNISVVIGKAKSKKTFFISLYVAAALFAGEFKKLFSANIDPAKNRVILFDTEQAKYKVHQVGKKIQKLSDKTGLNFDVLSLRSKQVSERLEIIERVIYSKEDICLVAIDGIRDLLCDINDPTASSELIGKLMKWTDERNIHIVTVLHQNKGDNNARGHVGTEAINKAETVISVTKDEKNPELSIVAPEFCREKEFTPFAIGVDDHGMPYVSEDYEPPTVKAASKKAKTPYDYPLETHEIILNGTFHEPGQQLKRGILEQQVKTSMQAIFGDVGKNRVLDFIGYYLKMGLIKKEGPDNSSKAYYFKP